MEYKKLQLQPRLQLLADLVPDGSRLADIGTDHGYLPVRLLQDGRIPSAIAADVGREPLQHAVRTAEEYGVAEIDFRLCDGLRGVSPQEVDTIVIAGMGGETMIHILAAADWTKEPDRYTLLLQPMTKTGELRRWLSDNGYHFTAERLVWDKDFLYPVMVVTGGRQSISETEQEYGVCLADDPLYGEFLDRQIAKLQRAAEGKCRSEKEEVRAEAQKMLQHCHILQEMRKEWSK
jgi:tRNA (adenine22-N1)-methyltransferase